MTHKELVNAAYKWVLKRGGCGVAFKELKSTADEIPDVIGFDSWRSIVIECKASRSDFLKDKHKPHRKRGMGTFRFYCCPAGIITVNELPDKWGLIYVDERGRYKVVQDVRRETNESYNNENYNSITYSTDKYKNAFEVDWVAEKKLMYTALRRLFIKGYVKYVCDKEYNKHTTPDELIELNNLSAIGEG